MFQYTDRYSNRLFIFPYSLASPVGFQSRDKSLEEKSRLAAKKGVLKEEKKKKSTHLIPVSLTAATQIGTLAPVFHMFGGNI